MTMLSWKESFLIQEIFETVDMRKSMKITKMYFCFRAMKCLDGTTILMILSLTSISEISGKDINEIIPRENRRGDWCSGDHETDKVDAMDCISKYVLVQIKMLDTC